ncbi:hypothetical protein F2Q70_00014523 [Brassica cretica]|uniref:Uncharacterized protein n=1 Tax=Brassica cretica TaxID=69181 RepID=A0A8S9I251_BRACR|nr:hypothetical protein F2Q70_00014523 [Brassica cretica]
MENSGKHLWRGFTFQEHHRDKSLTMKQCEAILGDTTTCHGISSSVTDNSSPEAKVYYFTLNISILFPVIVNHVTKGLAVKNLSGRLLASNGNLKHIQKIANQSLRLADEIKNSQCCHVFRQGVPSSLQLGQPPTPSPKRPFHRPLWLI